MSARTIVVICLASALSAAAQTAPPSQRVAPEASRTKASSAPHHAASPMKPKVKPRAAATRMKVAAAKSSKVASNDAIRPAGKRDPFVSPVRTGTGIVDPGCSVGKKCLSIDTIVLKGIVESQAGAIAVVESASRKMTYFLRENDPVFNGFVVKITPDSITFRENVMDRLGNQSTRDVVKRVNAPAV